MSEHTLPFSNVIAALPDPGNAGTIDMGPYMRASCSLTSTAAQTRTVAAPSCINQELTLSMTVDGGDITVTVNSGLTATLTFDDANDTMVLFSIDVGGVLKWKRIINV